MPLVPWKWSMLLVSLVLVALIACGGDDDEGQKEAFGELDGEWAGAIQSSTAGAGELRATLHDDHGAVTGTWETTFDDPAFNDQGTLAGTVNGIEFAATFQPEVVTNCPLQIHGTIVEENRLTGTFMAVNCTTNVTGSFVLTR